MPIVLLFISVGFLNYGAFAQEIATSDSSKLDSMSIRPAARHKTTTVASLEMPGQQYVSSASLSGLIAEDLADYVRLLPSISSLDYGSLGQTSPLSWRGNTVQSTRLVLNGFALQNPITGFFDSSILPFNLLQDLSFDDVRGTLRANMLEVQGDKPYSRVQFRAGDWGYSDIGITFGLPVGQQTHFLFSGGRQEYDGYFFIITPTEIIDEPRNLVHSRYLATLTHAPSPGFALKTILLLNDNNVRTPAPLIPDLVSGVNNARRENTRLDFHTSAQLGNWKTTGSRWLTGFGFSRIHQVSLGDSLLFDNTARVFSGRLEYTLRSVQNELKVGAQLNRSGIKGARLLNRTDHLFRMTLEDNINLTNNLKVSGSLIGEAYQPESRAINADTDASSFRVHPGIAFGYGLSTGMETWVSVGQVSRYPSFAERFWPTQSYFGDPGLRSERVNSAEIAFRLENEKVEWNTAVFTSRIDDWIGTALRSDTLAFGPQNLDERTTSGVETRLSWKLFRDTQLGLTGNYLHVSEQDSAKQTFVPEYSMHSYLEYGRPFFDNYVYVKLRATGRFYGARWGWVYEGTDLLPQLRREDPVAVLDGKASLLFSDVELTFSIENFFGKRYQLVPGIFMPPSTFRFSIDWQFWD